MPNVHYQSKKILSKIAPQIIIFLATVFVGLLLAECVIRLKNNDQKNYNIEMWRYAKELKIISTDPRLGHKHRVNLTAKLQGVEVRLNSFGMRGPDPDLNDKIKKRIIVLGSSNTLGWGVEEEDTMAGLLQKSLGERAQVFNAGIGNYNAVRYVTLFEKELIGLKPDIVVVHYFINDAEQLPAGRSNLLLRKSQLAVLLYHLFQKLKHSSGNINSLVEYYKNIYLTPSKGLQDMEKAFHRLEELAQQHRFQVILALVPDIHQLEPYPFQFIHDHMRRVTERLGWTYIDFTEALSQAPAQELWAMPGDPHLNSQGHKIMADVLRPYLE